MSETLVLIQGVYFLITGVWPLVHMSSFLAITGPKTDLWLVKTVGVVVAVIGLTLGLAGWNQRVTGEIMLLAVGGAAALGAVDVAYVLRRVIPRVYLFDAAAEAVLVVSWVVALTRDS